MYHPETIKRREVARNLGESLAALVKRGHESPTHAAQVKAQVLGLVLAETQSAEQLARDYEKACKRYLKTVIQVRGIPFGTVVSIRDGPEEPGLVSCTGDLSKKEFNVLLPHLKATVTGSTSRYLDQASRYRAYQVTQFTQLLEDFIQRIPPQGTRDKEFSKQITVIKTAAKDLMQWDRLFGILKQTSLVSDIDYLFKLRDNPIAAIWHYNQMDEDVEPPFTSKHRELDHKIFTVRGNVCIERGLMNTGAGFIDASPRPKQELGCLCDFQYLYNLRDLPEALLTEKGKRELRGANRGWRRWFGAAS